MNTTLKNHGESYNYDELNVKDNLMKHCQTCNIDLKKVQHSKVKNIVMNALYASDGLSEIEKYIYIFIYDFKAQQKYLPGISINQKGIAISLGISETSVSRNIQKLLESRLLIKGENQFGEKVFIPNENISDWLIPLDAERLSKIEMIRKHTASSNKQIYDDFKIYSMQENISSM